MVLKVMATRSQQKTAQPFNTEAAMKAARGFHIAAIELEGLHLQQMGRLRTDPNVSLGPDHWVPTMGRIVSSTVLEAHALELALKVRIAQAKKQIPRTHNHTKLFELLSVPEREAADQRYRALRIPGMRPTLVEALAYSADVFDKWRYVHEQPRGVAASMGEMQRAFEAIAHDLYPLKLRSD
jgi:hypothetical protein